MDPAPPAGRHELLSHIAVWACSLAYLALFGFDTEVRLDFAEELLRGRHLHEHGGFHAHGIRSTLPGYRHGSLWVHFLALLGGLGVPQLLLIKHALTSTAVTLVYHLALKVGAGGRGTAALSAAIALALFALATEHQGLWNMVLVPLPVALLSLLLIRGVTSGSSVVFVVCGLVLGLCADVLLVSAILGPVLIVAAGASANRPALAVAGACAALEVVPALSSFDVWRSNLSAALDDGAFILALVVLAAAIALGAWARRRFRALTPPERADRLIAASSAFVAVVCLAAALVTGLFKARYLIVIFPFVSVAAPNVLERWSRRRWPAPLVAVCLLLFSLAAARVSGWVVPTTPALPRYTYGDAEAIATAARREGFASEELAGGLRGPDARYLMAGIAFQTREPRALSAPPEVLRVLKLGELDVGQLPAGWRAVHLPSGDHAILGRLDSWVRHDDVHLCRGTGADEVCRRARPGLRSDTDRADAFLDRVLPQLETDGGIAGARRVTYALPVRIDGDDHERIVQLTMLARGRWWIERVTGVAHALAADRQSVTLSASGARHGTIVFGSEPGHQSVAYLPSYLETRPDERRIREWMALPWTLATICAEVGCH